jgi:hypothetical protein
MSDPFDVLREQLVGAAEHERRGVLAHRRWLIVAVAAALLLAASAAAAVVSLTTQESAPLSGTVPRPAGQAAGPASRYAVTLYPDLRPGRTGWCTAMTFHAAALITAGGGCGPAPTSAAAQIAGGGLAGTSRAQPSLTFVVVDRRVARVRLPDRSLIVPLATRELPFGWRAAVWSSVGATEPRSTLLDRAGAPLSTTPNERAGTPAAGTEELPTRAVGPTHPPRRRCAIRVRRAPGLRAISERIVATAHPATAPDVNARAFLACASAVAYLGRRRFTVAVLVDARRPHAPAAQLPAQRPFPAGPGVFDASGAITARRAGPAWLVVRGPDRQARLTVLQAVTTGR